MNIDQPDANITIVEHDHGPRQVTIASLNNKFIPVKSFVTNYPVELIELILEVKGYKYLGDEIVRELQ